MEIRKVETEYKGKKKFHSEDSGTDFLWQVLNTVSALSRLGFNQLGIEYLSGQHGLIL